MKIAMMSAWNQTSGVSIHAELVGEEWVKAGHELKVFSFLEDDFHGYSLIGTDQEYVTRCFGTPERSNYLNPIPFLKEEYDFFVVQDLGMLPKDKLGKIFSHIHRKAKTILVAHASRLPDDPSFFQFDWDAIVCFDSRYKDLLKEVFPEDKIYVIPFPCHHWLEGDKEEARRKLALPLDKKIVFAFGQKWRHINDQETVGALKEISSEYPSKLVILSGAQRVFGFEGLDCEIRKEVLEHPKIYDYLHAADVTIFGKHSIPGAAVLSSTVHLSLGSGCPILVRDSNFFDFIHDEVFKYKDAEEFKRSLVDIFQDSKEVGEKRKAVKRYVEENEARVIAEKFIELFKEL
jgi:hypothetical protein